VRNFEDICLVYFVPAANYLLLLLPRSQGKYKSWQVLTPVVCR
jgi:hypothetical protein